MPRVVVTGGPGAGKSTLLCELASMGYRTVDESARAVIAERRSAGKSPRPEPEQFAREILRRDAEKYARVADSSEWIFFDRGIIEAIGGLSEVAKLPEGEADRLVVSYSFYRTVFMLPPWEAIYVNDSERDHSFDHAVKVHGALCRWYLCCGYRVHEVPRMPVHERALHVLDATCNSSMECDGNA